MVKWIVVNVILVCYKFIRLKQNMWVSILLIIINCRCYHLKSIELLILIDLLWKYLNTLYFVFTDSCSEISVKCISNINNNNYSENLKRQQQN